MRDAAARGVRREATHQPRCEGAGGARQHDQQESHDGLAVRPFDRHVAPAVGLLKAKTKQRAHQSRHAAHHEGER